MIFHVEKLKPKIQDIQVKYPLTIVTDVHNHLTKLRKLRNPNLICLGDFTSLYDKEGEFNSHSLEYFIEKEIPTLIGNHEQIVQKEDNTSIYHTEYLRKLPTGFKLNLPCGANYLCFHNRPDDLWSFFKQPPNFKEIKKIYPLDSKTKGVIIGHHHISSINKYKNNFEFIQVGNLSSKDGDYAVLTENGIEFWNLEDKICKTLKCPMR